MRLTNCCSVPFINDDSDLCQECLEHADELEEEECCESRQNGFPCTCIKTGWLYSQVAEDDGYADYINDMRRDFEEDV